MMTDAERTAFLAERRLGLGASDIAAVLGLSRWKTAAQVWAEKLDMLDEPPMTEPQEWGLRLEGVIGKAFTDKTGLELAKPNLVYNDPGCEYVRSNWDRETETGKPVELKSSRNGKGFGPNGSDEVPDEYMIQVQTQIACGGDDCEEGYLAALIGGCDFRIYTIPRSAKIISTVRRVATDFWRGYVLANLQPPIDWFHPTSPDLMKQLAGFEPSEVVDRLDPTDDFNRFAADKVFFAELKKLAEALEESAKGRMLELSGGAGRVNLADGSYWTRKTQKRKEHTVKASEFEVHRLTWKGVEPDVRLAVKFPKGYEAIAPLIGEE